MLNHCWIEFFVSALLNHWIGFSFWFTEFRNLSKASALNYGLRSFGYTACLTSMATGLCFFDGIIWYQKREKLHPNSDFNRGFSKLCYISSIKMYPLLSWLWSIDWWLGKHQNLGFIVCHPTNLCPWGLCAS